jgi:hypothetical protein
MVEQALEVVGCCVFRYRPAASAHPGGARVIGDAAIGVTECGDLLPPSEVRSFAAMGEHHPISLVSVDFAIEIDSVDRPLGSSFPA